MPMLPCSSIDCKKNVVPLHNTKAYEGVELQLHAFLTSALDGVSDQLRATAALLSEKVLHDFCMGSCVGVWAGVDALE